MCSPHADLEGRTTRVGACGWRLTTARNSTFRALRRGASRSQPLRGDGRRLVRGAVGSARRAPDSSPPTTVQDRGRGFTYDPAGNRIELIARSVCVSAADDRAAVASLLGALSLSRAFRRRRPACRRSPLASATRRSSTTARDARRVTGWSASPNDGSSRSSSPRWVSASEQCRRCRRARGRARALPRRARCGDRGRHVGPRPFGGVGGTRAGVKCLHGTTVVPRRRRRPGGPVG